jgi:hypothetical protein
MNCAAVSMISRLVLPLLAAGFVAIPATQAQTFRMFVASFGNDANDGSRGSPKRTFQAAHDAVVAGGEIVAMDTAGFSTLTITKSISVIAPAGITGFITTSGSLTGINVNTAATDKVFLRGLTINAVAKSGLPAGIQLNQANVLSLSDCVINNYANGIFVAASGSGAAVILRDTTLRNNSNQGVLVGGVSAGPVDLVMERCVLSRNSAGVFVNNSSSAGVSHRAELRDVLATGNTLNGFSVFGPNNRAALVNCTFSANVTGIVAGNSAVTKVDNCRITANTTGVNVTTSGSLLSRGNNTLEDNGTDGVFTGSYTAK